MLTNLNNIVRYTVSGATYAITYPYWTTEEIKAYITLPDGTVTELTYGTDFTVTTPNGVNGTLTKVSAWTDAEKVTIVREVELTQEIDLINGEKIDGEQLETGLDLKTAGLQQLNEKFTRSVMTSIDETGDNMVIPNSTARKGTGDGTLLGFDGTGGNIVLRDLKQFDIDVAATAANATAAANSATLASKWAENPEDTPVEPSAYSAKHWAAKAMASATSASNSATTATTKAEDSESWAVGKRSGADVPATDPAYHNNSKYYLELVKQTISGALRYQGTWTTTGQTDYTSIPLPRLKGDMYYCQGTATTIDGVVYTQGDYIIFNVDVPSGTITTSMLDKIDNTETVTPDNLATLTNKTIDRGANTITNTPTTVSTTQTITPTKEMNVVIDTASVTLTIGDGSYSGQECVVVAQASSSLVYENGGGTVTISLTAGMRVRLVWNGSYWVATYNALITGTDADGNTIAHDIDVNVQTRGTSDADYSTSEVETGRLWIDGKPIYRKVVNATTTSGSSSVSVSALSIDTLVSSSAIVETSNGIKFVCPYYNTDNSKMSYNLSADNSSISVTSGGTYAYGALTIILEYTKTTD